MFGDQGACPAAEFPIPRSANRLDLIRKLCALRSISGLS